MTATNEAIVSGSKNAITMKRSTLIWTASLVVLAVAAVLLFNMWKPGKSLAASTIDQKDTTAPKSDTDNNNVLLPSTTLDTALYDAKLKWITNGDSTGKWPVKAPYPRPGAVLPFKRVVAYYGNLYSKKMGILGELPEKEMLDKLQGEVKKWQAADTSVEVVPALHYIAVTAQGSPGAGGLYRARMPFKEIDKILVMAQKINALVFIDIQVGLSTVQKEVPEFEKYLKMPNVHFGIDPEFSMKTGKKPGTVIGSFDATDINFVSGYLSKIVKDNNLPPKILVVHRFTQPMVTNALQIKLNPEVQVVMDMDGWGHQSKKFRSYKDFVLREPVQFTGFKLFYKNDLIEPKSRLLLPEDLLKLHPQPVYIQYQ